MDDAGKIYNLPYDNEITLSNSIKVQNYNNKIVDKINYKKIEEREYYDDFHFSLKQIQIEYSDGSIETFNLI